jgi:Xaa-Pro dipeptidase
VTLAPGLYVAGVGGVHIEHNYRVTEQGAERLSNHVLALT